jgi:hypothetical protein
MEAPEERSLPALLAPSVRALLTRVSRGAPATTAARRALSALSGFAKALKFKYDDLQIGLEFDPEPGLADSGDLETDLTALLASVGTAAAERDAAVVLFIDELQYVQEEQLAALIGALHSASQDQLPITMMAAGLPQLVGQAGRAKSYAERLFEFVPMDRLDPEAAAAALCVPAAKSSVTFDDAAISEIRAQTLGYPYFLQEWGKHSWNLADRSPIKGNDARSATVQALAELDASFFRVRFDRPDAERKALFAGHGRTWAGTSSLGEHRRPSGEEGHGRRADPECADRERDDL